MSYANTLFSTASQWAIGLGITLGAKGISVRLKHPAGHQLPSCLSLYRADLSYWHD